MKQLLTRNVPARLITLSSFAVFLLSTSAVTAADKWQGYVEAEGKYSKQRSIGEG